MASSSNHRHADTLREALAAFRADPMSLSSVEALCEAVAATADKLAEPTPISAARKRRGDRNLMVAINGTPMAEPRRSLR